MSQVFYKMAQNLPFSTVDVFTNTLFEGNQLAIVNLPHNATLNQDTKQAIAREFNFSESVFLYDAAPNTLERRLDIFTTSEELPFAGHPVIGTICYVCQSSEPPVEGVKLLTKAGAIVGRFDRERKMAEADIPHSVRIHQAAASRKAILVSQPALGDVTISGPDLPVVSIVKGLSFVLVELPSESLSRLEGHSQKIGKDTVSLDEGWSPSFTGVYYYVIVSRRDTFCEIRARMLEESIGEDAATGSAASTLASFLALQDGKDNRTYTFAIEQGVEMGRASFINVKVELKAGGKGVKSVVLAGSTVLVMEGKLHLPVM